MQVDCPALDAPASEELEARVLAELAAARIQARLTAACDHGEGTLALTPLDPPGEPRTGHVAEPGSVDAWLTCLVGLLAASSEDQPQDQAAEGASGAPLAQPAVSARNPAPAPARPDPIWVDEPERSVLAEPRPFAPERTLGAYGQAQLWSHGAFGTGPGIEPPSPSRNGTR